MKALVPAVVFALASVGAAGAATPWSGEEFFGVQRVYPAAGYDLTNGVRAVMIGASSFHGEETRVFAYWGLPAGASAGRKVPAMVLVHGGLGTAHEEWVRLWNSRGYAAIAMDTCGALPVRGLGDGLGWLRHRYSGPRGWGRYERVSRDAPEDQWTFHAVGAVIRSHSFLRSRPEVDAARVGLTGISWGGYLVSIVAGVDDRFAFAAPVYGTGRYDLSMIHAREKARVGAETAAEWLRRWDPANWMGRAECPFLFVDSNVDFAYPLAQIAAAAQLPKGVVAYSVLPGYGHSQELGARPEEIRAFADHVLKGGGDIVRFTAPVLEDGRLAVSFDAKGRETAKVELVVTVDAASPWVSKKWERRELGAGADGSVRTLLPDGFCCAFINVVTRDGLVFSCRPVFPDRPLPGGSRQGGKNYKDNHDRRGASDRSGACSRYGFLRKACSDTERFGRCRGSEQGYAADEGLSRKARGALHDREDGQRQGSALRRNDPRQTA